MYIIPISESELTKVALIYSDDDRLLHVCVKLHWHEGEQKVYQGVTYAKGTDTSDPSKMVMTLLSTEKMSPHTSITCRWKEIFHLIHAYDRMAANLIQHLNPTVVIVS